MFENVIIRTYQGILVRVQAETCKEHIDIALSFKDAQRAGYLLKNHFQKSRERILVEIKVILLLMSDQVLTLQMDHPDMSYK